MSSSERVEKFLVDGEKLLTPCDSGKLASADATAKKVAAEAKKLSTWVYKHQDELLPDAAKEKLVSVSQKYHKFALTVLQDAACPPESSRECFTRVHTLVDDLLKLPEGKLISSKSKQQILKWLEVMDRFEGDMGAKQGGGTPKPVPLAWWDVIDVGEGSSVTLMQADTGETREGKLDSIDVDTIRAAFDAGQGVRGGIVEADLSSSPEAPVRVREVKVE